MFNVAKDILKEKHEPDSWHNFNKLAQTLTALNKKNINLPMLPSRWDQVEGLSAKRNQSMTNVEREGC